MSGNKSHTSAFMADIKPQQTTAWRSLGGESDLVSVPVSVNKPSDLTSDVQDLLLQVCRAYAGECDLLGISSFSQKCQHVAMLCSQGADLCKVTDEDIINPFPAHNINVMHENIIACSLVPHTGFLRSAVSYTGILDADKSDVLDLLKTIKTTLTRYIKYNDAALNKSALELIKDIPTWPLKKDADYRIESDKIITSFAFESLLQSSTAIFDIVKDDPEMWQAPVFEAFGRFCNDFNEMIKVARKYSEGSIMNFDRIYLIKSIELALLCVPVDTIFRHLPDFTAIRLGMDMTEHFDSDPDPMYRDILFSVLLNQHDPISNTEKKSAIHTLVVTYKETPYSICEKLNTPELKKIAMEMALKFL